MARLEQARRAVEEGVDAACVGLEQMLRRRRESGKRALGMAVEVKRAQEDVERVGLFPEDLGEAPLAGAPQQLHLPQAVLGVHEAEREQEILARAGEHVRHPLAVVDDLRGRRQAGDRQRARGPGHGVEEQEEDAAGGDKRQQGDERHDGRDPPDGALHGACARRAAAFISRRRRGAGRGAPANGRLPR
jgi:hypothetical protein